MDPRDGAASGATQPIAPHAIHAIQVFRLFARADERVADDPERVCNLDVSVSGSGPMSLGHLCCGLNGTRVLISAALVRTTVKHLPKHLQPRWRYLAVAIETWPDRDLVRDTFQRALWFSAQNLLGDPGSAAVDLSVLRYRYDSGIGEAVVRVRRGEVDRGRAVVACVDTVNGDPVGLSLRGVSGTIRACEEKYMGTQPETMAKRDVAFADADRTAVVAGDRVDIRVDDAFVGATTLDIQ